MDANKLTYNKMRKKLLIFHRALPPYRVDFFNALSENFDCTIVFSSRNMRSQVFNQNRLLRKCRFSYDFMNIKLVVKNQTINWGYLYHIIKYSPDIIIGGEYGLLTIMPWLYKILLRKKYSIYTICDDSVKIAKDCTGIRKKLRDYLVPRLDGLILVSHSTAAWYDKYFSLKQSPIVFPIIKDEVKYRRLLLHVLPISILLQQRYNLVNKRVFLFVGRLVKVKNLSYLIMSFSKAHLNNETKLVIVGSGEDKTSLKLLVKDLSLDDKVIFAGRYEGDELYAWYNIANVFILPSTYEPFGAVTAEALQAGCPALVSCYAGSSDLIKNGENGHIFNPDDKEALSSLLNKYEKLSKPIELEKRIIRKSILLCTFEDCVHSMVERVK